MKQFCFKRSALVYLLLTTILLFFIIPTTIAVAQDAPKTTTAKSKEKGGGDDIFEYIIAGGYLIGVFVLFPWVVYTNLKEKLSVISEEDLAGELPDPDISEEERNKRAAMVLEEMEKNMTTFQEEGRELITITKGSQARFIRKGVQYIRKNLKPTDPDIIARVNELVGVYQDRAQRVFTGSKWIIGCAIGLGVFMVYMTGISTFIFIHFLGVVFYIMSSRTPMYVLEKRMKLLGSFGGAFVGSIFTGLLVGSGTKYYKVYSDGRRERDYESELSGGMIALLIMFVVAMIIGFLAAAMGVVNFLMNYMNNALIPTKPETWYNKTFAVSPA
ncbi:MAG: hypothetical protein P8X42_03885 [Calditrichaceae bacterium]|jgi:hypothetical protein